MSEWPIVRLGDYCSKIGSGATPRGGASVYLEEGEICLIRSQNIYNEGFKPEGLVYITEGSAEKLKNVVVEESDVLLNITGDSVARVCLAKEEYLPARVNQHVAIVRPDPEEFDARYLRYLLASQAMQNLLLSIAAVGATRNALTKNMIETLEVSKPPLAVQETIADKLESLDNKIELNRQTNQTLEQIAQAIFKSWFVDFEPTRAKVIIQQKYDALTKAEREGFDLAQTQNIAAQAILCGAVTLTQLEQDIQFAPQLPMQSHLLALIHAKLDAQTSEELSDNWLPEQLAATADLFPDALVDSELGEVPEGWIYGELRDIAEFTNSRVPLNELNLETYISTENMLENKKGISKASSLPSVKTVPAFKPGDILVSNIRPYFKKIWLARFDGGRSGDVLGFSSTIKKGTSFLYNLLYQDEFFNFMMMTSKGAKMPRGDKDAIMGWACVQPSEEIVVRFATLVDSIYPKIEQQNVQSLYLENIRNILLPKLLSGELSVTGTDSEAV